MKLSYLNQAQEILENLVSAILCGKLAPRINRIIRNLRQETDPYRDTLTQFRDALTVFRSELDKKYNLKQYDQKNPEEKLVYEEELKKFNAEFKEKIQEINEEMKKAGDEEREFKLAVEKISEEEIFKASFREKHKFDFSALTQPCMDLILKI